MDDLKNALVTCCKKLRLSTNLVERAMVQSGGSNQEYLLHLLNDEVE